MKTTEEVCRQFGFEYAPMRITFKKKKRPLQSLTPGYREQKEAEARLLREIALIIGISFASLIAGLIIIAVVTS